MPDQMDTSANTWNVLLVEDNKVVRRQVHDYLAGEVFALRQMSISDIAILDEAFNLVSERKADLIILDIYRGEAREGGERTGLGILDAIKCRGFVPVVIYTALPEGLEEHESPFVRLVGKEPDGLERLKDAIADLFTLRIPQVHRAIINHIDQTMRNYMWGFVQEHWKDFGPLCDRPEFLRLIIQRLAMTFAREGIEKISAEAYGTPATEQVSTVDVVHPAECYVKPPMGKDPMLGDIRLRRSDEKSEYLVVLWPTCDMVSTGGRVPKTESALCARASLGKDVPEIANWLDNRTNAKQKKVERLLKNTREHSPDRYHFLPGVWDIPDLLVDFQALEHVALEGLKTCTCLGTIASPFAEALAARFQRYIGRIGTPDFDLRIVLSRIEASR